MSVIEKVVRAGLCTGCGLCEGIAGPERIRMQMSPPGYLRPQRLAVLPAGLEREIKAVCPGVSVQHEAGVPNYHPIWGPLQSTGVGYALDPEVRHIGSSGGVISALCIHLLETGRVDFVAQIAVSSDDPLRNDMQISRSRADVLSAAGSRYAPSAPLQSLHTLLATGERFAFVGKPCDVAALRAYLRLKPELNARIPVLLSFMCAGIPSLKGSHEVVDAMGGEVASLKHFRYRGDGWPGMARAEQADGRVFEMDYNTSWGQILNRHLQFRCKVCADGTGEFADLVCADAWHGKDGYPDFAEREGRSLILARTDAGRALLAEASQRQAIAREPLAVEHIAGMQPFQLSRKRLAAARALATLLARGRSVYYRRMGLLQASRQEKLITILRNAWGTYRRAKGEPLPGNQMKAQN